MDSDECRAVVHLLDDGNVAAARDYLNSAILREGGNQAAVSNGTLVGNLIHQPTSERATYVQAFFERSTRLRDHIPDSGLRFVEVQLVEGKYQLLIDSGLTLMNLLDVLQNDQVVVWLTEHSCISTIGSSALLDDVFRPWNPNVIDCEICRRSDEDDWFLAQVVYIGEADPTYAVRFLAQESAKLVELEACGLGDYVVSVSAGDYQHTLRTMPREVMETLRDGNVDRLSLRRFFFPSDCCRLLGSVCNDVELEDCAMEDEARALFDQIAENQGPTALELRDKVDFDMTSLLRALDQSMSLTKLTLDIREHTAVGQFFRRGLRNNQSLIQLEIESSNRIADDEWKCLFDALKTHPTLRKLEIREYDEEDNWWDAGAPNGASGLDRTRWIEDMLRTNTSLSDLSLGEPHRLSYRFDHHFFNRRVKPRLEANRYRARAKNFLDESDGTFQGRLVGEALANDKVIRNPTAMWLFVSKFHETVAHFYETAKEAEEPARKKLRSES